MKSATLGRRRKYLGWANRIGHDLIALEQRILMSNFQVPAGFGQTVGEFEVTI